ncbi:YCP4 [Candida margitis]|uniref:YCP4 n=1 Tax=Candida margitis TaxID=1775924 RepID=UPI0022269E26|nr:YCP4 [Candida margitis]KAI5968277.1 YCP4 [Candida margitis]
MKIAIIVYSTYGHIITMAKAVQEGVSKAGYHADLFQVPETLPQDILDQMHAPPKSKDIPIATLDTLTEYDAFLFGIPTRFGTLPAQFFEFFGATGGLWAQGALYGKPAGIFVSTGTQGGGQETTVRNSLNFLAHHGMPYIPLGYAKTFPQQSNLEEIHGGSAYGAGTFASPDGSRQPTELELQIATMQGEVFAQSAAKFYPKDKTSQGKKEASAGDAATAGAAAAPSTGDAKDKTTENKTPTAEKAKEQPATQAKDKPTASAPRANQATKAPESEDKSFCSKCIIM